MTGREINQRITKVCRHCGSENVSVDAVARWSVDAQRWEISGLFDISDCDDCGSKTDVIDKDLGEGS